MEEALGLLSTGDHSFSLRALARRAGVSAAAPYHHFGDKEGLLAAVAAEGFEALRMALDHAVEGVASPSEELVAMVAAYVRFAAGHPAHYRVMFLPDIDRDAHPELHTTAGTAFARLAAVVGRIAGDTIDPAEVRARSGVIWAMAHGVAQLEGEEAFDKLGLSGMAERTARAALALALLSDEGSRI